MPGRCQKTRGHQVSTSAYTGWHQGQARAGTGQEQCRTVPGTVPRTVPEPVPYPPTRHPTPTTRQPDTRHPHPAMYLGYLVTQCRPLLELLLLYPIFAKVGIGPCGHHASATRAIINDNNLLYTLLRHYPCGAHGLWLKLLITCHILSSRYPSTPCGDVNNTVISYPISAIWVPEGRPEQG